jgi:hypothetical protein
MCKIHVWINAWLLQKTSHATEGVKNAAASGSSGYNIGCAFAANYSDGVIICTVTKLINTVDYLLKNVCTSYAGCCVMVSVFSSP